MGDRWRENGKKGDLPLLPLPLPCPTTIFQAQYKPVIGASNLIHRTTLGEGGDWFSALPKEAQGEKEFSS